ncbi:MAG: LysR family transcriptional regulator [Pseudomonadales bacterium]|nr:LysR family transcriptional regulator [Pseudomonadales bacterium]
MSIHHLSLRDLGYVCAVAEHLNFSRAADAKAITQPAMSERIRHSEEVLGCLLFERNKRRVLVTPKGKDIVALARSILDTADAIDGLAHAQEQPLSGTLRLGVIATLGPYLIPHLLRPLATQYPNLELHLTEGLTEQLLDTLTSGGLDLVLAAQPVERDGVRSQDLFFEPFYLAAPKGHSISINTPVATRTLNADDMILLHEGHCLSGQALDACPTKRSSGVERLQATGLETLRHMIASGSRYSLLPALAVGKRPPMKALIDYVPLADHRVGRRIAVCWRNSYRQLGNVQALADTIRTSVPNSVEHLG